MIFSEDCTEVGQCDWHKMQNEEITNNKVKNWIGSGHKWPSKLY